MTPMTDERLAECRCIREEILECLECHAPLERVPRDRMLNEDQWDAVKAGDYFCSGDCRSDKARSGKRYFNRGQLPTFLLRECALCIVKSDNDRLRAEVELVQEKLASSEQTVHTQSELMDRMRTEAEEAGITREVLRAEVERYRAALRDVIQSPSPSSVAYDALHPEPAQ